MMASAVHSRETHISKNSIYYVVFVVNVQKIRNGHLHRGRMIKLDTHVYLPLNITHIITEDFKDHRFDEHLFIFTFRDMIIHIEFISYL